jgi:hypothetical protein
LGLEEKTRSESVMSLRNGARSWRKSEPHPVFRADGRRIDFDVSGGDRTRLHVAEAGTEARRGEIRLDTGQESSIGLF